MTNARFVFITILLFLIEYLFSVFWPFLLQINLFIVWALTVFFLDQGRRINMAIFLGLAIFFDFWSGSVFGLMTLALSLEIIIIFLIKKVMLIDRLGRWLSVIWLTGCYYLFIFLNIGFYLMIKKPVFPVFSFVSLLILIGWLILFVTVFFYYEHEKKGVPSF